MKRKFKYSSAIITAATLAIASAPDAHAVSPALGVMVREEEYADSIDITQNGTTYPGSAYSFGFAFNVNGPSGTEVTALDVALEGDQAGNVRQDGTAQPAGQTSAPVRLYSYNSATSATTELANVTITSSNPMSPFSTGGGPVNGGEAPRGPVITYNQYQLPKPVILYPVANTTYYVVTDVPKNYELYLATDGYPGSAHADPAGNPFLSSDQTITFLNEVSSRTNNAYVPDPTSDYLSFDRTGYRGGFNANLEVQQVVISTPASIKWIGASGNNIWNTTSLNFNIASGTVVAYSDFSNTAGGTGDNVTFNDSNGGAVNYNVSIPAVVHPTSLTVSNSAGNYLFNGSGGIAGATGLAKSGTSALTLSTSNSYTGLTNVSGGSLILASSNALPSGANLNIGSGASVVASNLGTTHALVIGTLSVAGKLDVNNNALIIHNSSIGAINALVTSGFNGGSLNGSTGIVSTTAATSTSHLTALGTIQNSSNGSSGGTVLYTSFEGKPSTSSDVLVKYTYYGDANLDGMVDGSDYSRLDAAYLADQTAAGSVTGWYNGDFNYDGMVNGSDYTLIDNAFNSQNGAIASELADPDALSTAEIADATNSVPEPTTPGLLGIAALGVLRRRRGCR